MKSVEILIEEGVKALSKRVANAKDVAPLERAHVAWVLGRASAAMDLQHLAKSSARTLSVSKSYHDIAVLGYAADRCALTVDLAGSVATGLDWLLGRSPRVAGEPAGFVTDGVAVLGIVLGARSLGGEFPDRTKEWLSQFLLDAGRRSQTETWQEALLACGMEILGGEVSASSESAAMAEVGTALRARGTLKEASSVVSEKASEAVLKLVKTQDASELTVAGAGLRLAAVEWIRRTAPTVVPGRVGTKGLVELLDRVPAGLRRWTWESSGKTRGAEPRKWHVDNEYHVQNLLYSLLAPLFPDLKEEEYFPSVGQKQPRTDLFLPSMKTVVEVKFLRRKDKVAKVIDEVAADAGLYLGPDGQYAVIVAFVWDDSRRSEEHHLLAEGLRSIRGVDGAVIVSRPGSMV